MNVPKVSVNITHQKWCQDFLTEQNRTTSLIRKFIKKRSSYNPFDNRYFDKLLKRYEKSFWG